VLLALLLPVSVNSATPPNPDAKPDRPSLAGQLLVATEAMGDPRFRETVLVMVRHNADGAFALVVNRPAGEQPVAGLLEAIGQKSEGAGGTVPVYAGGPVERHKMFVLHSGEYRRTATLDVTADLALTGAPEIFRDIAAGTGPRKFLIAFGYAGWSAGQLEGELARNAWYTASLDPKLVFDADREKVWELAVERRTRDL
jgi:putative transcriptional regulator